MVRTCYHYIRAAMLCSCARRLGVHRRRGQLGVAHPPLPQVKRNIDGDARGASPTAAMLDSRRLANDPPLLTDAYAEGTAYVQRPGRPRTVR